jgi:DNA-binding CsgD family transcriptional regulator
MARGLTIPRASPTNMDHENSDSAPFDRLTERQRIYLRHVFQHRTSDEIAYLEGVSGRAVDKQLNLANRVLGVTSRFEAARRFAEFEAGVEGFYPASVAPSRKEFWPLPLPLPTKTRPLNDLSWQQVLAWGLIIMLLGPIAITVCTMVIIALKLLIGVHPS